MSNLFRKKHCWFSHETLAIFSDVLSPSVLAYDDLTKGKFAEYLDLSSKIGGDVQAQVIYIYFFISVLHPVQDYFSS